MEKILNRTNIDQNIKNKLLNEYFYLYFCSFCSINITFECKLEHIEKHQKTVYYKPKISTLIQISCELSLTASMILNL